MSAKHLKRFTMSDKLLHIVSFDVPHPADYGGVIDVFYKIKALHESGIKIILHSNIYGRSQSRFLKKYCEEVKYYKRKKHIFHLFSRLPFIVKSRINKELLSELRKNNAPILVEGLHNAWLLEHNDLAERTYLRTHNVEHEYYQGLAKNTSGLMAWYYKFEAKKLSKFEKIVAKAKCIFAISDNDTNYFKKFGIKTLHLPPFFDSSSLILATKSENPYILYHGNLNVLENQEALNWLYENVFLKVKNVDVIVAGKCDDLVISNHFPGLDIRLNLTDQELNNLLSGAKTHVLYSQQNTGIKLKLLNALRTSGNIIVNDNLISSESLKSFVSIENTAEEYLDKIENLSPLTDLEITTRKRMLSENFNLVQPLIDELFVK